MSEPTPPEDLPQLGARASDAAIPVAMASTVTNAPPIAMAPVPVLPPLPPEMAAFLEVVSRGLAPDCDDATRAMARELWTRCAQAIAASAANAPPASRPELAPGAAVALAPASAAPAVVPVMPVPAVPASPIALAAQQLRGMPADQLLDLALQRLRAALPPGAAPSTPKGIQFQLVPVSPPPGSR